METCEFHSDACGGPGRLNDQRSTRLYRGTIWDANGGHEAWFCFHHHMLAEYGLEPVIVEGQIHYVDVEMQAIG